MRARADRDWSCRLQGASRARRRRTAEARVAHLQRPSVARRALERAWQRKRPSRWGLGARWGDLVARSGSALSRSRSRRSGQRQSVARAPGHPAGRRPEHADHAGLTTPPRTCRRAPTARGSPALPRPVRTEAVSNRGRWTGPTTRASRLVPHALSSSPHELRRDHAGDRAPTSARPLADGPIRPPA